MTVTVEDKPVASLRASLPASRRPSSGKANSSTPDLAATATASIPTLRKPLSTTLRRSCRTFSGQGSNATTAPRSPTRRARQQCEETDVRADIPEDVPLGQHVSEPMLLIEVRRPQDVSGVTPTRIDPQPRRGTLTDRPLAFRHRASDTSQDSPKGRILELGAIESATTGCGRSRGNSPCDVQAERTNQRPETRALPLWALVRDNGAGTSSACAAPHAGDKIGARLRNVPVEPSPAQQAPGRPPLHSVGVRADPSSPKGVRRGDVVAKSRRAESVLAPPTCSNLEK